MAEGEKRLRRRARAVRVEYGHGVTHVQTLREPRTGRVLGSIFPMPGMVMTWRPDGTFVRRFRIVETAIARLLDELEVAS
jgi:hypothetical protein